MTDNSDQSPQVIERTIAEIEMVYIPAGDFIMGSPDTEMGRYSDEGPQHEVTFDRGFWMGKYTVTQAEWLSVMGSNPSGFEAKYQPVENVSWDDTQCFLHKLNKQTGKTFRLPSEAEWEYAARAGTTGPFGFDLPITPDKAKYDWSYDYKKSPTKAFERGTSPVNIFNPNSWDLYQMHGNVWEWVQDCWHENYKGAPSDGSAWESGGCGEHVFRGGSWYLDPALLRSANRDWFDSDKADNDYGFRLVHDELN